MQGQAKTLWKNPLFTKLFLAYSISTFGDWFDMIAIQVLLAYVWKISPMEMALLPLTYAVPGILFGQLAGVLADRTKKRRLMIAADLLSAAITALLLFAPNVTLLYVLLTLRSFAGTFNAPAQQALTRQVVAEEHLLQATTWNGMINQLAKVLGPLGGALVVSLLAPQMCLLINSISFLLSGLILLFIRTQETEVSSLSTATTSKPRFRDSWREGWLVVLRSRVLLASLSFSLIGLLSAQMVDTQFALLFHSLLPDNKQVVGWSIAMVGISSFLVITYVNRRYKTIRSYGLLFGLSFLCIGIGCAWLGLLHTGTSLILALLPGFVTGIGNGIFLVLLQYVIQKEPPADSVGRVAGIMNSVMSAAVVIAPLLGGVLMTSYGISFSFRFVGVILGAFGILALLLHKFIWGIQTRPLP